MLKSELVSFSVIFSVSFNKPSTITKHFTGHTRAVKCNRFTFNKAAVAAISYLNHFHHDVHWRSAVFLDTFFNYSNFETISKIVLFQKIETSSVTPTSANQSHIEANEPTRIGIVVMSVCDSNGI